MVLPFSSFTSFLNDIIHLLTSLNHFNFSVYSNYQPRLKHSVYPFQLPIFYISSKAVQKRTSKWKHHIIAMIIFLLQPSNIQHTPSLLNSPSSFHGTSLLEMSTNYKANGNSSSVDRSNLLHACSILPSKLKNASPPQTLKPFSVHSVPTQLKQIFNSFNILG